MLTITVGKSSYTSGSFIRYPDVNAKYYYQYILLHRERAKKHCSQRKKSVECLASLVCLDTYGRSITLLLSWLVNSCYHLQWYLGLLSTHN